MAEGACRTPGAQLATRVTPRGGSQRACGVPPPVPLRCAGRGHSPIEAPGQAPQGRPRISPQGALTTPSPKRAAVSVALRVHTAVHVHDTCPLSEHGLPTARRAQAQDPVQGQPSEAVGQALQSQPWGRRVPSEALGRLGAAPGCPRDRRAAHPGRWCPSVVLALRPLSTLARLPGPAGAVAPW